MNPYFKFIASVMHTKSSKLIIGLSSKRRYMLEIKSLSSANKLGDSLIALGNSIKRDILIDMKKDRRA